MLNSYLLRSLSVLLSTPLKYDLKRSLSEIKKAFEICKQQEKNIGFVEYSYIPRKRCRVTYLKSRFKHRKAIRHYVFEQYNYNITVLNPVHIDVLISSILGSLSPSVHARCTFSWNYPQKTNNLQLPYTNSQISKYNIHTKPLTTEEYKIETSVINRILNSNKVDKDNLSKINNQIIAFILKFSRDVKLTEPQLGLKKKLNELSSILNSSVREKQLFLFNKPKEVNARGLYIYGGVGQGKTMLMDSFYETLKVSKKRIHFHEFMIQIQKNLHDIKTKINPTTKTNLINLVCDEIVNKYKLLCLDEFHVTHISDAMILKELFTTLFNKGLVLVCTSNRAPEELYKNGLNRDRFLPFIPILYKFCDVYHLDTENFRQKMPNNCTNKEENESHYLDSVIYVNKDMDFFTNLYSNDLKIDKRDIKERWIQVTPLRKVRIPLSHEKVAFLTFSDLFPNNSFIGTDSLIKIGEEFRTFFLTDIPEFDANLRYNNKLKIFIQFIDILYEKIPMVYNRLCVCNNKLLFRNLKLVLSTSKPLIYIFGSYGIIKLFDEFYNKIKSKVIEKEAFEINDFINLTNTLGIDKRNSEKLFDSLLNPDEKVLTTKRLLSIIDTHEQLTKGLQPKNFILYKLDTYDDDADEEEFQCSRTLSRLFHMSTKDYLMKC
ncbi:uncharacterized protein TA02690 [Theileria annulata]|uniref:AFG1-like ATPase n=1 Tax=Theileria annulata TaxID=5874 RepID=Q4UD41_THEAN|nr:uncharacterized protein TA02690 [Theileria annulata]CAI75260.1 hypothetical protein, conserved [Theileria annulata]|eukprot:XP_954736.1 hypothetical protein, conserved [Theileria annulata]